MRVKQCCQLDCTDFSTHESQLCEKHLTQHLTRCAELTRSELKTEQLQSLIREYQSRIEAIERDIREIKNRSQQHG